MNHILVQMQLYGTQPNELLNFILMIKFMYFPVKTSIPKENVASDATKKLYIVDESKWEFPWRGNLIIFLFSFVVWV